MDFELKLKSVKKNKNKNTRKEIDLQTYLKLGINLIKDNKYLI